MAPLWKLDEDVFRAIHVGWGHPFLDAVFVCVTFTGLGHVQILACLFGIYQDRLSAKMTAWIGVASAVGVGLIERSSSATVAAVPILLAGVFLPRALAGCCLAALASSGLFRLLIVPAVARQRPSNLPFAEPLEPIFGHSSFPSGHTTTTAAIATVIVWHFAGKRRPAVVATALVWALLVALSRVYVGVHYPLDVVAGLALGVAFGTVCHWIWRTRGWLEVGTEVA